MGDLLMVVPSRGRPDNADAVVNAWQATSAGQSELCFVVDRDDPDCSEYQSRLADTPGVQVHLFGGTGMVAALNDAAVQFAGRYRYLGFMGDDHRPRTAGWDAELVEAMAGRPVALAYGDDLLQGEAMPTAVAMTSSIVSALGYMAPPTMTHLCVDLVWKLYGERLGALTYLPDVIIEHMHPANGKAPRDAGYERVNSLETVAADSSAYYAYVEDGGQLDKDVATLRNLLRKDDLRKVG